MNIIAHSQTESTNHTAKTRKNAAMEQLRELGLLDAATVAQVATQGNKWIVPSFDPITGELSPRRRVRTTKKKTFWNGDKSIPVNLISGLPGWQEAVKAADGVVYLAAGEKDYLAFIAAGVRNVLLLLNEIPNPDTLKPILTYVNARLVIYPHDCDKHGRMGAAAVRAVCTELNIHFEAKNLFPDEPDSKKDLFDFWELHRDGDLRARLEVLPESDLPIIEQPDYTPSQTYSGDGLSLWERWVNEVVKPSVDAYAPIVKPYRPYRDGYRRLRPDDKTPSFIINYKNSDLGTPIDFGGAGSMKWNDLAAIVGATPFADWIKSQDIKPTEKRRKRTSKKQDLTYVPGTKSNGKRAPVLQGATVVHGRYMSDVAAAIPSSGVICYRGDKGNGKTHFFVHNLLKRDGIKRSVYIVPNTKPGLNLCEVASQAGVNVVHHSETRDSADLRSISHLATTPFQAHKLIDPMTGLNIPDALVIDESMTALTSALYGSDAIWQGTSGGEGGAAADRNKQNSIAVLHRLIKETPYVFILDADLNNALIDHIRAIRGKDDIHVIENTFTRERGHKVIYKNDETALEATVTHWLQNGGRAAYCHTSKGKAKETRDLLQSQYGISADTILVVTNDTSSTAEVKAFTRDPDRYLADNPHIKHLIYNSSLGQGFSIQTPFSVLFGHYGKRVSNRDNFTHSKNLQMEDRLRNVDQYHVYVEPNRKSKATESAQEIYDFEYGRAKLTAAIAGFDDKGLPVLEAWHADLLKLQSTFQAIENAETNRFRDLYIRDSVGHKSLRFNNDTDGVNTLADAKVTLASDRDKHETDGILTAEPIDKATYDRLAQRGETDEQTIFGHENWKIQQTIGRDELTRRDVERYKQPNERAALSRFVDVRHERLDTLKEMDRRQASAAVNSRQHRTIVSETLEGWIDLLFGDEGLNPHRQFEKAEIIEKADKFKARFHDWKMRLGVRSDKSSSPMSIARRLFSLMGHKLVSENSRDETGKQRRLWSLDQDIYTETIANSETAYQARCERRGDEPLEPVSERCYKNGISTLLSDCETNSTLPDLPPDTAYRNQVMSSLEQI